MPDPVLVLGAATAGGCFSAAVAAASGASSVWIGSWASTARRWLIQVTHAGAIRGEIAVELERAAWNESPERMAVLGLALAGCAGLVGASTAPFLSAASAAALATSASAAGLALPFLVLKSAADRRRSRLAGELVPVLELFALELGGGGSPFSALGAVATQVRSELAADLRRMLIASQVAGSAAFDARLLDYAERLDLPPLAALATILASSRDYGTGAGQGVRALAADLRRAQRRELIAHSRRALNHVLLPAAVGVLLPFLAILMFPAVTALQQNLR